MCVFMAGYLYLVLGQRSFFPMFVIGQSLFLLSKIRQGLWVSQVNDAQASNENIH